MFDDLASVICLTSPDRGQLFFSFYVIWCCFLCFFLFFFCIFVISKVGNTHWVWGEGTWCSSDLWVNYNPCINQHFHFNTWKRGFDKRGDFDSNEYQSSIITFSKQILLSCLMPLVTILYIKQHLQQREAPLWEGGAWDKEMSSLILPLWLWG